MTDKATYLIPIYVYVKACENWGVESLYIIYIKIIITICDNWLTDYSRGSLVGLRRPILYLNTTLISLKTKIPIPQKFPIRGMSERTQHVHYNICTRTQSRDQNCCGNKLEIVMCMRAEKAM